MTRIHSEVCVQVLWHFLGYWPGRGAQFLILIFFFLLGVYFFSSRYYFSIQPYKFKSICFNSICFNNFQISSCRYENTYVRIYRSCLPLFIYEKLIFTLCPFFSSFQRYYATVTLLSRSSTLLYKREKKTKKENKKQTRLSLVDEIDYPSNLHFARV